MAEIVNLNKARKARQRAERADIAQQNRTKFGESKASKAKRQAESDRIRQEFEGHRLSGDAEDSQKD